MSSVAKKFLNAITGIGLGIFVIVHLSENLLLLTGNPDDYNRWTHFLFSFGPLLTLIELGLAAFFIVHIWSALMVYWDKLKARPSGYSVYRSAGWTSRQTLSSQTMIYTGIILLAFVIWHVVTFRFGPYYTVTVDGVEMRDLHRLVVEVFRNPVNVALYVAVMVLLGAARAARLLERAAVPRGVSSALDAAVVHGRRGRRPGARLWASS
jgi:succinate dehydrogenase / fumarate reductase cytochrome b subunit